MSRAAVELDFLGLEKINSESQFQKFLRRRRSFRDIHGSISKIDPLLLKTVIESGSVCQNQNRRVSPEITEKSACAPKPEVAELYAESAPLTIFYNGVVTVYEIPRDKAESIIKLAVKSADLKVSTDQNQLLETLNNGDLPIFRKKSLQRFLEKRRERLTLALPYASPL